MGTLQFLDPACGCGNFLIIAYRELRALELRIHGRLQELDPARAQLSLDAESRVHVKLSQFHGIEIEEWPATIARTAMFLMEHQANQAVNLTLGYAVPMLPLQDAARITVGNALRTDWSTVLAPSTDVIVMGNPPFLGHATRTAEQAQELRDVWQRKDIGRLDYVTGWYCKALDYFGDTPGRFAFVSTNSIAQGEPVPALFGPIFDAGWRIRFAHRSFAWSSEAPGAAAVHCAIVGFDRERKPLPRLFNYADPKDTPIEVTADSINGYLVDGPNVLVEQRRNILGAGLGPAVFGNMARDGGHLIVEPDQYDDVMSDPIAAKYVRPFIQARELIHNAPRWCLWLVDLDPTDATRSQVLKGRLDAVRSFRSESRAPSTQGMAMTPHLFGQRSQPDVPYVCIPRHFSEERQFATVASFGPEVICGDANFKAEDPDGYLFAILSSSMFIAWQRAVGGTLESRLRFSNTIVWNSLPLPEVSEKLRLQVISGGQAVLAARELHPERSLAQHYAALSMDPALLKAHRTLDAAVDKAFGARRTCTSDLARQKILFERYSEMTGA